LGDTRLDREDAMTIAAMVAALAGLVVVAFLIFVLTGGDD
jgi:hypothetical protein